MSNPSGTPLPGKPDNTVNYGRNNDRVFAPQRSQFDAPDVYDGRRSAKSDARVREHRAQQYREWHRRAKGRPASDAEVNAFLDGPDEA